MKDGCLICNASFSFSKPHITDIFSDKDVLPSNGTLLETIQDILDISLDEERCHSRMLCQKCHKSCLDYDEYKLKMKTIKADMCREYTTTSHSTKLKTPIKAAVTKPKIPVVVSASKLVPVPADFQFNLSQITQAVSKANNSSPFNFKVASSSTVSQNTSPVKLIKPTVSVESIVKPTVTTDITKKWDVHVPKDIFSTADDSNHNDDDENNGDDAENNGDENENAAENGDDDDNEMEIDEDCSVALVPVSSESQTNFDNIKVEESQLPAYTDIITLTQDGTDKDGNFVLGKLKIFSGAQSGDDDDDDEQHTIVLNGDNASILEMMAGQKVIFENGGLSLVMEDEADEECANADDGQDSAEESQIELQVSGDEETANAIIAAAQEQGGAFIKVESGEMYRVKSVQSADDPLAVSSRDVENFVTKEGSHFTCNLCKLGGAEVDPEKLEAGPMMQHLKVVHDAKIYLCPFCGRGLRRRHDYTKHLALHSGSERAGGARRLHACAVCHKCYNSRTLLHEHMNTHTGARPHTCPVCHKGFASKYTYNTHLKTHQARPRPYQCNVCDKSFLSLPNLRQHKKIHTGIKDFICSICDKAFGTQHNLEIHSVVHSSEKPFVCTYCDKGFSRKADLADHLRTHTGERPFECEICEARFAQRSNLHSHRRATHLDDKRHQCPDCSKRFKRRRLLEYHIKATHTGERPLKCEMCLATFVYPEHYKKHVKIHTGLRPYSCEICGKAFSSRDNRNTHRFTHSEKKPYECLECGQSFMRKRTLIGHMNESGHFAESIVVNQPRVTRVDKSDSLSVVGITTEDRIQTTKSQNDDDKIETVFHTSGRVKALERSAAITKITGDEQGKIFVDCGDLDATSADQNVLLDAVNAAQLDEQATHFGADDSGSVLRLIQVKLPSGADGWVALND